MKNDLKDQYDIKIDDNKLSINILNFDNQIQDEVAS